MTDINLKEIAKHIARYATCKPKLAMDRLMRIELIRNNYSKTTLYNFVVGARRMKKDGYINKAMPKELAKEIQAYFDNPNSMADEPIVEPKELTLEEQLANMKTKYNQQVEYYDKQIQQITDTIIDLENKRGTIDELKNSLKAVYYEQKQKLIYNHLSNKLN